MAANPWLPLQDALNLLRSSAPLPAESVSVPLLEALNRVASQDVFAPVNVPPCDNSAMDGYVMHADDAQMGKQLPVVARIFAGDSKDYAIARGECARIMTGAPIPAMCNAVFMQEDVTAQDDQITLNETVGAGANIRPVGADIVSGDCIIKAGTRLTPAHLTLLSSLGLAKVSVYPSITVGLLATGDELKAAGEPLAKGQIYESNRIGVAALLHQCQVTLIDYGIVPDHPQTIRETLETAAQQCDLVISSGGVSVGDADFIKDILAELGDVAFWKVAIKPGKPFAFGHINNALFCGLPGNPVSAYVTTEQLVVPLIRQLQGEQVCAHSHRQHIPAVLSTSIKRRPGRLDFQRATFHLDADNKVVVTPHAKQSSGVMTGIVQANCYMLIPADVSELQAGDSIMIQPFSIWENTSA